MTASQRIGMMSLGGGLGSRLYPLTGNPGVALRDMQKRGLNPGSVNTNAMPKPLAPLAGVPLMLPLAQRVASSCGVEDIGMALMYMPEDMKAFFGPNMDPLRKTAGGSFYWEHQKNHNLDTAGCLVRGWLEDMSEEEGGKVVGTSDNYIVVSGDIRSDADVSDMLDAHITHNALVTIGLSPVPWDQVGRFGTVIRRGDKYRNGDKSIAYRGGKFAPILGFEEKNPDARSNLNNASIYIFRRELFESIFGDVQVGANKNGNGYCNDHTDGNGHHYRLGVFSRILVEKGQVEEGQVNPNFSDWAKHIFADITLHHPEIYAPRSEDAPRGFYGYLLGGLWADDGTLSALLESNHELLYERGGFEEAHDFSWWPTKFSNFVFDESGNRILLGENTHVSNDARVIGPSYIGDNVTVEAGATVINSVINGGPKGRSWTIGRGAWISNSSLWPDRSALGLSVTENCLGYDLRDMSFDGCIIGGGFPRRGRDNVFCVDEDGQYHYMGSDSFSFRKSVIIPTPSCEMVVRRLD